MAAPETDLRALRVCLTRLGAKRAEFMFRTCVMLGRSPFEGGCIEDLSEVEVKQAIATMTKTINGPRSLPPQKAPTPKIYQRVRLVRGGRPR